jgi:hypothetical protein
MEGKGEKEGEGEGKNINQEIKHLSLIRIATNLYLCN